MLDLRPVVVDPQLKILGGNMRLKAALEAGLKTIPVLHAERLTPEQQKEFIIKDNLSYGEWNFDALREHWDVDQLEDWGLDIPPLQDIISEIEQDEYDPSPEDIDTDIAIGDIIYIGDHRLLCGDSTNPDHVNLLLAGNEPRLMITDPPYGVEYDAAWRDEAIGKSKDRAKGRVQNDEVSDWSDAWSLSPSKVAYVYHAGKYSGIVQKSLEDNLFMIRNQIIWFKNHHVISRGDYNWKHEPCWYAVKKGATAEWIGDNSQSTVWEIDKPTKSDTGHSTQKPVECMARPMRNHKGDVYDPFLGSGTTMVAAQQMKRVCYGMEISPKYCQIALNRMKKLFPELEITKLSCN